MMIELELSLHSRIELADEIISQLEDMKRPIVVVLSSLEAMKLCNFSSSDVFSHRPTWLQNVVRCIVPGIVFKGAADYHENRRFLLTNLKSRGMGRSGLEGQLLEEVELLITHLTNNNSVT